MLRIGKRRAGRPPAGLRAEAGTASVELVAAVPLVLVGLLIAAQVGAAGYSLWSAGISARAGARAVLTGAEAEGAALRALPGVLEEGAEVEGSGPVSVAVAVPRLLPGMPEVRVTGQADLGDG